MENDKDDSDSMLNDFQEKIKDKLDDMEENLDDDMEQIKTQLAQTRIRIKFFTVLSGALLLLVGISFRDVIHEMVEKWASSCNGVMKRVVEFIIIAVIVLTIVFLIYNYGLDEE